MKIVLVESATSLFCSPKCGCHAQGLDHWSDIVHANHGDTGLRTTTGNGSGAPDPGPLRARRRRLRWPLAAWLERRWPALRILRCRGRGRWGQVQAWEFGGRSAIRSRGPSSRAERSREGKYGSEDRNTGGWWSSEVLRGFCSLPRAPAGASCTCGPGSLRWIHRTSVAREDNDPERLARKPLRRIDSFA